MDIKMADKYLESCIVNRGNWKRLKECMKRAEAGGHLTIGNLGGSITMGSVATRQELCYAYLSHLWWKETFPQADISFVNAGIGATTSQFGVARADEDLLAYRPDVVFIEFSVNDDNEPHFKETYEGLVRRIYCSETKPAVVLLHNAFYDDGHSAEEIHTEIGRYYQVPGVSFKNSVMKKCLDGLIEAKDVSPDNLHPNDLGHSMLAETVKYFLNQVYGEVDVPEEAAVFPEKPVTKNRYEDSKRYRNPNLRVSAMEGFAVDTQEQRHITEIFRKGWTARQEGAFLECDVNAAALGVQFRRSVAHPAPSAKVIVDGDSEHAVLLNGEYDETWGDLIALQTVFENEEKKEHHIRIELCNTHPDDKVPFYLVSVIEA